MIIDVGSVTARTRRLHVLPCHQVEFVAFEVGERGHADRGQIGVVELLGAQAGEPPGLLVVLAGEQDGTEPVPGRPQTGGWSPASPTPLPARRRVIEDAAPGTWAST